MFWSESLHVHSDDLLMVYLFIEYLLCSLWEFSVLLSPAFMTITSTLQRLQSKTWPTVVVRIHEWVNESLVSP